MLLLKFQMSTSFIGASLKLEIQHFIALYRYYDHIADTGCCHRLHINNKIAEQKYALLP